MHFTSTAHSLPRNSEMVLQTNRCVVLHPQFCKVLNLCHVCTVLDPRPSKRQYKKKGENGHFALQLTPFGRLFCRQNSTHDTLNSSQCHGKRMPLHSAGVSACIHTHHQTQFGSVVGAVCSVLFFVYVARPGSQTRDSVSVRFFEQKNSKIDGIVQK